MNERRVKREEKYALESEIIAHRIKNSKSLNPEKSPI